jgi:hypothetical protein
MGETGTGLIAAAELFALLGFLAIPAVFIVLVALLVVAGSKAEKERRAAMQAWVAGRGWAFAPDSPLLINRWSGHPFGSGHSRKAFNVATGTFAGRPAVTFDYRYTTGSGKNRTTHHYHVVAMGLPASLPYLQLTPENFGSAIAKVFGGDDIDFESEQFNRTWRVRAVVPRFAFDVIHPRLMERLLRPDARLPMRIHGPDLITWTSGRQQPQYIDWRLGLMDEVIDSVPDFVWRQVGHDPHRAGSPTGAPGGDGRVR